jgi:hypothetical protein
MMNPLIVFLVLTTLSFATGPQRFEIKARASQVDPRAREHPEINFVFEKDGKPQDLQHACIDTRVSAKGKLVIWLMPHNPELFHRLSSYGLHAIQIHYANGWFSKLYSGEPPADDLFLSNIRLEAATGQDHSPAVSIPHPDGIMERSHQFVRWLEKENPEGEWDQFFASDAPGLDWSKIILAGISHGSTTAARLAKHIRVDRVVMFSGPRDQFEVWQKLPSATPIGSYFGFTHILDDGWKNDHYCRSWILLGLNGFGPLTDIDTTAPPYGHTRRLITNADVNNNPAHAHNAVIPGRNSPKNPEGKYLYEPVWKYLFTHPTGQYGIDVPAEDDCRLQLRP